MSQLNSKYEALAIAYLTGQATAEEVSEYKHLYNTDAGFKEIVDDVEIWLAPLNENIEDNSPPDSLLNDIMREIAASESSKIERSESAIPAPTPPSDPVAANDKSVSKWRAAAIVSSLIAVLAVGSHFISSDSPANLSQPGSGTLMSLMSASNEAELVAIIYDPNTGKVVARLSNITAPEDADFELWLIREGEPAPVSLGVLSQVDESDRIEFLAPLTLHSGTDILAISLESEGGSTSSGPEGPVLYTGAVSTL